MKWIWSLLLMLAIGCAGHQVKSFHYVEPVGLVFAPRREYKVWVDREFDLADRKSIDEAINEWNRGLNGHVVLRVVDWDYGMEIGPIEDAMRGGGWIVLKILSSNPMVRGKDRPEEPSFALAWVDSIAGNRMFVVRDRVCSACVYGVMLHEIGHLLGARHGGELLMHPTFSYERYRCIDYAVMKRVALVNGLDIGKLRYCVYE